jgi:stearoyl-CoA desaturase (delta-9 desaturase)
MLLAFICYYIGGVGITAGYHRLWSHRSYDASLPVRVILLIMGTGAFEGSVFNWCADHRAHHRFTDTEKDPYNVNKGFMWAHIGWLLWKRDETPEEPAYQIDISDLKRDPLLVHQDRYYLFWAGFIGLALPTLIAGIFWGDWRGGFFYGAMAKSVFLQHATFFINSLAHTWGTATYSDRISPRDSYMVSLFTFGEGYHNFHHEFPYDYRNGLEWFHYDPGKWLIRGLNYIGLTYNLKRFPSDLFHKGQIQVRDDLTSSITSTLSPI